MRLSYIMLLIFCGLISGCKSSGGSRAKTGHLRILDIKLVDSDTGRVPDTEGILVGPVEPQLDGPILQEMPISPDDPNRYRVRVTWIQHKLVDQMVKIMVPGYIPYVATINDIETFSSSTSIGGQITKTVKLSKEAQPQR